MVGCVQDFHAAAAHRVLVPAAADRFPTIEQLLHQHADAPVQSFLGVEGSRRQPHSEVVEIRKAIEEEATEVLRMLKCDEWRRSNLLVTANRQRALSSWKALNERTSKIFSAQLVLPKIVETKVLKNRSTFRTFPRDASLNKNVEDRAAATSFASEQASTELLPAVVDPDTEASRIRSIRKVVLHAPLEESLVHLRKSAASDSIYKICSSTKATVLTQFDRPPRNATWIPLNRNVTAEDESILRAVPYFGDDDAAGFDVTHFEALPGQLEPEVLGEAEELAVVHVIDRHKRIHEIRPEVYSALSNVLNLSVSEVLKAYERVQDGAWYRQRRGVMSDGKLLQEADCFSSEAVSGDAALVALGGKEIFFDPDHPVNLAAGKGIGLGILNTESCDELLGAYRDFFCRRCYTYLCHHGVEHPLPRERVDPSPPFLCPVPGMSLPTDNIRNNRRHLQPAVGTVGSVRGPQSQSEASEAGNSGSWSRSSSTEFADQLFWKNGAIVARTSVDGGAIIAPATKGLTPLLDALSSGMAVSAREHEQVLTPGVTTEPGSKEQKEKRRKDRTPVSAAASGQSAGAPSAAPVVRIKRSIPAGLQELYRGDLQVAGGAPASKRSKLSDTRDAAMAATERVLMCKLSAMYESYCPGALGLGNNEVAEPVDCLEYVSTLLGTRSREEVQEVVGTLRSNAGREDTDVSTRGDEIRAGKSSRVGPAANHYSKLVVSNKNSFQLPYEPCNHDGPCTAAANCKCVENGTFCEKYCGCSQECRHRFPGCRCKKGACLTKICPCFAASRVCDPDLCGPCGAFVPPALRGVVQDPAGVDSDKFKLCKNLAFHSGAAKKLLISTSQIHGWGAYLAESVEKNEFIAEYVGEVVSQEEAERRGIVYDKFNSSYLFELNRTQSVDATRKGNKSKFINHSEGNANCYPRIVQIDGDHKVALFSKRAINAGEELTFDYMYSKNIAPEWAKGSTGQARASLVGATEANKKTIDG